MAWLVWIALALIAFAGEALTTALVLGSFAVAAVVVAPLSLALAVPFQVLAFAVLSLVLLGAARPALLKFLPQTESNRALPRTAPVGRQGHVVERIDQFGGQIRIGSGEFWSARSTDRSAKIQVGQGVEIISTDGLTAVVRPIASSNANPDSPQTAFDLSAREVEVLGLVAEGLSNQEIAGRLVLSTRTVDHHVSHILNKMGAASRVEAVRLGMERGLLRVG